MSHTVNLAIQILPLQRSREESYAVIDKAIELIQRSGMQYVVCPFETVIEGTYPDVIRLLDEIQEVCREAGADSLLVNMKLHRSFTGDVRIEDKTGKYTA